jgi:uncharacterized membrane protein YfcA
VSFGLADHLLAGLAGGGAGMVNAIAGGGTLISFPALVALGVPNVKANITNTVALSPGYFGGAAAQRRQMPLDRAGRIQLAVAAGFGGLTGSILLLITGEAVFKALVPWLILGACALLGFQQRIRKALGIGEHRRATASPVVSAVTVYLFSIYGGYFGAGLGIAMLAILGLLLDEELPRLNALKSMLSVVINVVAACFFAGSGKVVWTLALVMAPASLLGGIAGGTLVGVIKPQVLRAVVVTYGTVLALYYLVR